MSSIGICSVVELAGKHYVLVGREIKFEDDDVKITLFEGDGYINFFEPEKFVAMAWWQG